MSHAKKMILVGARKGWLKDVWEEWGKARGYEVEYRDHAHLDTLSHEDSPLVIMDDFHLNDAPFPERRREVIVPDAMCISTTLVCAAIAVLQAKEDYQPVASYREDYYLKDLPTAAPAKLRDVRSHTNASHKRGNRRYRWC